MKPAQSLACDTKAIKVYHELFVLLHTTSPVLVRYLQELKVKTMLCVDVGYQFTMAIVPEGENCILDIISLKIV